MRKTTPVPVFYLSCIEHLARRLNRLEKVGIADRHRLNKIHGASEERLKRLEKSEVAIRVPPGRNAVKLHQEIQVAGHRVVGARGCRPEDLQTPDVELLAQALPFSPFCINNRNHGIFS